MYNLVCRFKGRAEFNISCDEHKNLTKRKLMKRIRGWARNFDIAQYFAVEDIEAGKILDIYIEKGEPKIETKVWGWTRQYIRK